MRSWIPACDTPLLMADIPVPGSVPSVDALWPRRRVDWAIWTPAAVLALLVGACFLAPLSGHLPDPTQIDLVSPRLGLGSPGHILGTDDLGRDLLSRALYGGQVSIEVGVASVALGLVIGASLGMVSGFVAGWVDSIIMRTLDILLAFPSLILSLTVATYLGPSERNVVIAIAFFTVPTYARVARAATLQIREREFVLSSAMAGAKTGYVIVRHVLPNISGRLLTYGLLTVGVAMIVEASLSFLGLGIRPPQASWGAMIAEGKAYLTNAPQIALVPGAFLFVAIASLNLLGDGLRSRSEGRAAG
jgi:peptide/nickel transport system permease protein